MKRATRWSFLVGLVLGATAGAIQVSSAHGDQPCQTYSGTPFVHVGHGSGQTDHGDNCWGLDRYDSMWGYGGPDQLHGRPDRDHMRGAEGNDDIFDEGANQADTDKACEGDGNDDIYFQDGDGKDTLYATGNDGQGYEFRGDSTGSYWDDVVPMPGQSCPITD